MTLVSTEFIFFCLPTFLLYSPSQSIPHPPLRLLPFLLTPFLTFLFLNFLFSYVPIFLLSYMEPRSGDAVSYVEPRSGDADSLLLFFYFPISLLPFSTFQFFFYFPMLFLSIESIFFFLPTFSTSPHSSHSVPPSYSFWVTVSGSKTYFFGF